MFEMKDLDRMHYFLRMEVWQNVDRISLGQGKYVVDILKRFGMMECKAMTTPMALNLKLLSAASSESIDAKMYHQMIYFLMYLTNTRPNIYFAVNTLRHVHLMVAKHVVRYLKGTVEYGIKYEANQKTNLEGYVDSDWAGSAIYRKSTSCCSKKQSCVALSTADEKDVATCYLGGSMFLLKTAI